MGIKLYNIEVDFLLLKYLMRGIANKYRKGLYAMKKSKMLKKAASGAMALMLAASAIPMTAWAEEIVGEWREENGARYWYENGVKQGTEGRGKEIYDPGTDAWYWLDSIAGGKMATGKDVYQESEAGRWGDIEGENGIRYGKWVRYDENGHMIKGWDTNEDGTYYFDPIFGTMAKGETEIDGIPCIFDMGTGIGLNLQWVEKDGAKYWYEGGVRQGYDPNNADYRGKEIYDPASDAWYWLDNVDQGKMATGKDVYQESDAGQWADRADGTGKWVRYDENGHMIKGWDTNANGTYYFDPIYGTMAKGTATIDGVTYYFDENTGICQGEVDVKTYYTWRNEKGTEYDADGNVESTSTYTYDSEGNRTSYAYKSDTYETTTLYDSLGRETEETSISSYSETPSYIRTVYTYDGDSMGESKSIRYRKDDTTDWTVDEIMVYTRNEKGDILTAKRYYDAEDDAHLYNGYEYKYNERNQRTEYITYNYDNGVAEVSYKTYYEYDGNGNLTRETQYVGETQEKYTEGIYTYDENNNEIEYVYNSYYDGEISYGYKTTYEYDANGNCVKQTQYNMNGERTGWTESTYQNIYGGSYYTTTSRFNYNQDGVVTSGYEYFYTDRNLERQNYYGMNKTLTHYTVYDTASFPKSEEGATFVSTDYYYDGSDNLTGRYETEYRCYAYTR